MSIDIEDTNELTVDIRNHCRDLLNQLSHESVHDKKSALQMLYCLIPPHVGNEKQSIDVYRYGPSTLPHAQLIFIQNGYERVVKYLLEVNCVEWWKSLGDELTRQLYDSIFIQGVPHVVLTVLVSSIQDFSLSWKLNKCVSLLERFLAADGLRRCLMEESVLKPTGDECEKRVREERWTRVIAAIASLPTHLANKLRTQNSDMFKPEIYIGSLSEHIVSVLSDLHHKLRNGQDVNLSFLGKLIAKIALVGYSDLLWPRLLDDLEPLVVSDFLWSRICCRLVSSVPDRGLESVCVSILSHVSWYKMVEKILGDIVLENKTAEYLVCTKLPLLRYFDEVRLLQNMIGYLATSEKRHPLFVKLLERLLEVWSDGSALRHTSHNQHVYITRAIMICLAFIKNSPYTYHSQELLQRLMPGVQHHLGCTDLSVRSLGMALAQEFVKIVDTSGIPLEFEYEVDDEITSLLSLLTLPTECDPISRRLASVTLDDVHKGQDVSTKPESEVKPGGGSTSLEPDDNCLDSDDDLEPYDMSHDMKKPTYRAPHYIRDCMEGLISNDDGDRVEACLKVAESLIRSQPSALAEIAAEFAKILLHLADGSTIPQFTHLRSSAMVALSVASPIPVSTYLTGEFYKRNYNVKQRLDMLEVLSKASQELTSVDKHDTQKVAEITDNPETWRDVVSRRIESKTRRFHTPRQPAPPPTLNKFASVAGYFLFPLISNYDSTEAHCQLLGEDSLLLCRLVSTTGVIMHSATNTPIARQMVAAMFDFLWILRYHKDSSVRHAVLFSLAMTCLSLTPTVLFTHFPTQISDCKSWLQDLVEKDPNEECKKLALQLLYMLNDCIRQA